MLVGLLVFIRKKKKKKKLRDGKNLYCGKTEQNRFENLFCIAIAWEMEEENKELKASFE